MGYAVELLFDEKSEAELLRFWQVLHEHDICSYMYTSGGKPHIALAVFDSGIDIVALQRVFAGFFANTQGFRLLLSSLGIFPGDEGVSFVAPKVSMALLQLHEDLYSTMCMHGLEKYCWEYYKPDFWIPHCTMTINTGRENQIRGMELIRDSFSPMEVAVVSANLVEFPPVHIIEGIRLQQN